MTKKIDLTKLNDRQRHAVRYGLNNGSAPNIKPLLVIAGAGTGKTNILAHRVAYMIEKGMDPGRILLLTFSRRAADEMTNRVKRIIETTSGGQQIDLPWSGTFHAVAAKLIREHAVKLGLSSSFTILDRSDAADLMNLVRCDLGFSAKEIPIPIQERLLGHIFVSHPLGFTAEESALAAVQVVSQMGTRAAKALSGQRDKEAATECPRL
jgi:DNA helicase II / ATP-dependent DNA helicase PcrA